MGGQNEHRSIRGGYYGGQALSGDRDELLLGEFVYQAGGVPRSFSAAVECEVMDWEAFGERLMALCVGRGKVGRPPYHPVLILKMLLLA